MGWLGKGALGLILMVAGLAGFLLSLYELAKTCASGGPYVSARECPSDTPYWIGGLTVGIVVFLIGGALFATRGRRATDPGLPPPQDQLTANPPPLSGYYHHD